MSNTRRLERLTQEKKSAQDRLEISQKQLRETQALLNDVEDFLREKKERKTQIRKQLEDIPNRRGSMPPLETSEGEYLAVQSQVLHNELNTIQRDENIRKVELEQLKLIKKEVVDNVDGIAMEIFGYIKSMLKILRERKNESDDSQIQQLELDKMVLENVIATAPKKEGALVPYNIPKEEKRPLSGRTKVKKQRKKRGNGGDVIVVGDDNGGGSTKKEEEEKEKALTVTTPITNDKKCRFPLKILPRDENADLVFADNIELPPSHREAMNRDNLIEYNELFSDLYSFMSQFKLIFSNALGPIRKRTRHLREQNAPDMSLLWRMDPKDPQLLEYVDLTLENYNERVPQYITPEAFQLLEAALADITLARPEINLGWRDLIRTPEIRLHFKTLVINQIFVLYPPKTPLSISQAASYAILRARTITWFKFTTFM